MPVEEDTKHIETPSADVYTHYIPEELMFGWIFAVQNFTDHTVHVTHVKLNPVKEVKQEVTSCSQRKHLSIRFLLCCLLFPASNVSRCTLRFLRARDGDKSAYFSCSSILSSTSLKP